MQLVFDIKKVINTKTNEVELIKRFDDPDDAVEFIKNYTDKDAKHLKLVPVILNDDFSDPMELQIK